MKALAALLLLAACGGPPEGTYCATTPPGHISVAYDAGAPAAVPVPPLPPSDEKNEFGVILGRPHAPGDPASATIVITGDDLPTAYVYANGECYIAEKDGRLTEDHSRLCRALAESLEKYIGGK